MQKENSYASTSHDQSRIASDHGGVKAYGVMNKESELEYITSKEKKERKNTEILYRTSSSAKLTITSHGNYGDSCNFVSSEFNNQIENGAIKSDIHSHNLNPVLHGSDNRVISSAGECCAVATNSDISSEGSNAAQMSVRAKQIDRTRMEFNSRRTEFQSVELDEEKPDMKTPVYEDMDPAQAILSQHRLAAFLASPDCAPDCVTPSLEVTEDSDCQCMDGPDGPAMPSESLTVGRCGPELAEAALQAVGTVTKLPNNTVAFVADDLTEKIRLASPSSAGSGASTPRFCYNHHCHYHHQHHHQYPGPLTTPPHSLVTSTHSLATPPHSLATPPYLYGRPPPLDPTLLNDIERHARRLATNVDGLIESLTDTLHGISALTVDCVEAYRDTVCKTCDAVDANIKSMYQLMAKSEELSKSMKPVCALHAQIKDVRRTLDILDAEMHS